MQTYRLCYSTRRKQRIEFRPVFEFFSHLYSVVPLLFGECVGEDLAQGDLAAMVRVAPTGSSSFYGARGN